MGFLENGGWGESFPHLLISLYLEEKTSPTMPTSCPIPRWQQYKSRLNNLPREAFLEACRSWTGSIILDVRTPEEYRDGHLDGAISLDYFGDEFLDDFDKLDKQRTYLVYCRSGRRSVRVCTLMRNAGFSSVYQLDGGLMEEVG
jgi:rhodanese-related sulfurtransferase